jgi:Asp-tRNA(Asn)/Glu-tRNA(Gln) amidotransferase A subunit family amidase
LPTGFSTGGLPLAMQIIGRHFDEATVFRVAAAYEQEAGWQLRHPDLEAARAEA